MPPRSGTSQTAWNQFKGALRSNENFEYLYWIQVGIMCVFDWLIRILGPVLVVFTLGLISFVVYIYLAFILPAAVSSLAFKILNLIWCTFCVINIFFNYLLCVFTKPGTTGDVREYEYEAVATSLGSSYDIEEETETVLQRGGRGTGTISGRAVEQQQKLGGMRRRKTLRNCQAGFCKKCQDIKPVRAHHCHVCDKCILNMDHHCPWVNNCVGYYNHRYFVLFLVYLWAGCFYAALVTLPQFIKSYKGHNAGGTFYIPFFLSASRQSASAITLCFMTTVSIGVAISALLAWNLYLLCTAQTTIEFYENQNNRITARHRGELFSNPFNFGWRKNWAQVFGNGPILLTIVASPSLRKPPPPIVSFFEGATKHSNQDLTYQPEDAILLV